REHGLDAVLDLEEERVDLVVERDHLVRELGVAPAERPHGPLDRRDDAVPLLLQLRLEPVQCLVDGHAPTVQAGPDPGQTPLPLCHNFVANVYPTRRRLLRTVSVTTKNSREETCRSSALSSSRRSPPLSPPQRPRPRRRPTRRPA